LQMWFEKLKVMRDFVTEKNLIIEMMS
jgi:hypothetical protein